MFVTGYHAIEETLKGSDGEELLICRRTRRIDAMAAQAQRAGLPVRTVSSEELNRLCGPDHRGVALVCGGVAARGRGTLQDVLAGLSGSSLLVVLLDEVQDPQNLGAILRSADQLAADLVVTTARRSAPPSQTVLRSSAGASAHNPPLPVANLVQAIRACQQAGFWMYGADTQGTRLDQVRFEGRVGLVMGSEGTGLRRLVKERCDQLVRIPAAGHVDSYNVSVAAAILMYEIRRQQGFPQFQ